MTTTTLERDLKKTADDAVKLAKDTADTAKQTVTGAAADVRDNAHRVFLAGLGAFVLAEEEGSRLFDKLVKKGRKVELPNLRRRMDESADAVMDRAKDARYMAGEAADKAEDRLQDTVAGVMKRLGVPTNDEVAELTASVERLNKKLDALKKERKAERAERAAQPEVSFTVEAVGGGWYELKLNGVVVEKVQGKEEAETALARLAEQKA